MNRPFSPEGMSLLAGQSPELRQVLRTAHLVGSTPATVLILGESGTGKELLAQVVHRASKRADRIYAAINCAALTENLIESELFGHRRGAFTGAVSDYTGRIPATDGGTLFLDEVAELPLSTQAKILRFLDSGECQAVGDTAVRRADVRLIAATNRDLRAEVANGRFRADLFYRLNVVPLHLPPLRGRDGDVAVLVDHFTNRFALSYGVEPPTFRPEALAVLARHSWPGNVRELRNFCERTVVLHAGGIVSASQLPDDVVSDPTGNILNVAGLVLPEGGLDIKALEVALITLALRRADGNQSAAARLLGLSRDTFLYRIKKYAIRV